MYHMNVTIQARSLDEAASAERALHEEFGSSCTIHSIFLEPRDNTNTLEHLHEGPTRTVGVSEELLTDPRDVHPAGEDGPSMNDVIVLAQKFAKGNGPAALVKVLKNYGVKRVSELSAEQLQPFFEELS